MTLTDADLAAIRGRVEKARATLIALCRGNLSWTMSVPADGSRDPDLIFDASLRDIPALLAEVTRLRAENEGERQARVNLDAALRKKDAGMAVLFDRMLAAGVDYSDLIP